MSSGPARLVIASRESKLALWQAHYVRARVSELYPRCELSILGLTTTGDRVLDVSLAKIGGKGLFVKELELALQERSADIAVHSMKDVPMDLPPEFDLLVVDQREDARDAFVSNNYARLEDLPAGSVVGTSSLRRESQIRHRFPRLRIEPLRGNVETRLRKLDRGDYAAIVLAAAGLKRLERADRIRAYLEIEESLPAVGQGALGIEFLTQRTDLQAALAPLTSNSTSACVHAERALSRRLAGSCNVPLAAHATLADDRLRLRAMVASPDGQQLVRAELDGTASEAAALGTALAEKLIALGAGAILARIAARQP